ncbi:MAG: glutaredoxin 3 [Burkholderiales bacterium]|jgi:glutaredoxin 3|nr:glutaredoxin 3 [Burkholderiales bacterium]
MENLKSERVKITMYSTAVCPYCQRAEMLLKSKGVTGITKIRIDETPEKRDEMIAKTGRRTVPQIFIGNTHVGGFDDLAALDRAGGLEPLLREQPEA